MIGVFFCVQFNNYFSDLGVEFRELLSSTSFVV